MKKTIFALAALTILSLFTVSCNKENLENVDNYVNESVQQLEASTRTGRGGCFELVFPVSISFSDGSQVEVDGYDALKTAIKNWRKDNGKPSGFATRPHFVYPIDVITKEGETVTVNSLAELIQLRRECLGIGNGQGKPCFRLNYPVTLIYPDGNTISYATPKELRTALREWKKNNQDATVRPVLSYPMSITMEDGSIVTVNSKEELKAIKENCK